jgi:hypothetical protein
MTISIVLTDEQVAYVNAQSGCVPPVTTTHPPVTTTQPPVTTTLPPLNTWPPFIAAQRIGEWLRPKTIVAPYTDRNCYKNWDYLRTACPAADRAYCYATRAMNMSNQLPEATGNKLTGSQRTALINSCAYFSADLYAPDPVYFWNTPFIDRQGLMHTFWENPQTGERTEQLVKLPFPDD